MQSFDAAAYRGKRIRYRAAVNTSGAAHAGLWLRVDRNSAAVGFFENMQARPIRTQGQWQYFEIDGFVHMDAKAISLGILAYNGPVRFDDASFTVTGEMPVLVTEGPRPLAPNGLRNVQAFATLYGLVRHFHPSDQAAVADWNFIAIEGARKAETAEDLPKTLLEIFLPVAPSLRVFKGEPPPIEITKSDSLLRLQHKGFGQQTTGFNIYNTKRIPAQSLEYHTADIGQALTAIVPLSVYKDETGTLPHAPKPAGPLPVAHFDASDRATRLGGVIIAWNVFQHFYPYFDVAQTDWKAVLPVTLNRAAIDTDGLKFQSTLRRTVAALMDGHGGVYSNLSGQIANAPLTAAWIENKYIVIAGNAELKPGDEIVAVNGKPAAALLSELEEEISSATRPFNATELKGFTFTCDAAPQMFVGARPQAATTELQPGIWYVEITRATDKDFEAVLPMAAQRRSLGMVRQCGLQRSRLRPRDHHRALPRTDSDNTPRRDALRRSLGARAIRLSAGMRHSLDGGVTRVRGTKDQPDRRSQNYSPTQPSDTAGSADFNDALR